MIVHELFGALRLLTFERFQKSVRIELLYSCCVLGFLFLFFCFFFLKKEANGSVTLNNVVEGGTVMVNVHLNVLGIHCKCQCKFIYVRN